MDRLWQMNGWLAREARFLNTNLELFKQFCMKLLEKANLPCWRTCSSDATRASAPASPRPFSACPVFDGRSGRRRRRRGSLGIVGLSDFADEQVRNPQDFEPPVPRHPAGRNYRYGARTKPTLVADRKFELLALRRGQAPTTSELIFDRIAALHQEDRVTFAPGRAARRRSAQIMRTWLYARD
jgi:hypothetical protein